MKRISGVLNNCSFVVDNITTFKRQYKKKHHSILIVPYWSAIKCNEEQETILLSQYTIAFSAQTNNRLRIATALSSLRAQQHTRLVVTETPTCGSSHEIQFYEASGTDRKHQHSMMYIGPRCLDPRTLPSQRVSRVLTYFLRIYVLPSVLTQYASRW